MCKITGEIKKKKKNTLAGESCLTSVSPPPSSVASCPAGPLSGHARPRRPSGPTGPASGPYFLAPPCYRSKVGGLGGARALLLWGPRLGQPWEGRQETDKLKQMPHLCIFSAIYTFHSSQLAKTNNTFSVRHCS